MMCVRYTVRDFIDKNVSAIPLLLLLCHRDDLEWKQTTPMYVGTVLKVLDVDIDHNDFDKYDKTKTIISWPRKHTKYMPQESD